MYQHRNQAPQLPPPPPQHSSINSNNHLSGLNRERGFNNNNSHHYSQQQRQHQHHHQQQQHNQHIQHQHQQLHQHLNQHLNHHLNQQQQQQQHQYRDHHHQQRNQQKDLNQHIHNVSSSSSSSHSYTAGLPKHFIEERQDIIFRRVRGILNKITPETFDKLSKELINVGLDTPRTLRGLIYLLFDKALKDLKYSSLYAKLCQELSERAPNFETEPGPNTFCKFLISKCEDEFERRRKATEMFDIKNELTEEEYEQRAIVKQKMLGNIKFICELGKKRLLQEEILHECIRGLLSKKKHRQLQDQAQDLECLCQIMRTIGNLLDINASKNLMNQYFERIDLYSKKPELPSRIRFMLRDIIDLRNNSWRTKPFQRDEYVPQPLSRLREQAGFLTSGSSNPNSRHGNKRDLMNINDLSKLPNVKMLLDDEPGFTTSADIHWGPAFLSHLDDPFEEFAKLSSAPIKQINNNINSTNPIGKSNGPLLISSTQRIDPIKMSSRDPFNDHLQDQSRSDKHKLISNPIRSGLDPLTKRHNDRSKFERKQFQELQPNFTGPDGDQHFAPLIRSKMSPNINPPRLQQHDQILNPRRFGEPNLSAVTRAGATSPLQQQPQSSSQRPTRSRFGRPQSPEMNRNVQLGPNLIDLPPNSRGFGPRNNSHDQISERDIRTNRPPRLDNDFKGPSGRYVPPNNQFNHASAATAAAPAAFVPPTQPQQQPQQQQRKQSNNSQPNQSESGTSPSARFRDSASILHQERNPKFPMGRNQSADNLIPSDADRNSNWRRAAPIKQIQPSAPIKEQREVPQVATAIAPILPKPLLRINDPNLSLRPSHNLIGRNLNVPMPFQGLTRVDHNSNDKNGTNVVTPRDANDSRAAIFNSTDKLKISADTSQTNTKQQQASSLSHSNQTLDANGGNEKAQINDTSANNAEKNLHIRKFNSIIIDLTSNNVTRTVTRFKDLKIPKNYQADCLVYKMKQAICGSEVERTNISKLLSHLIPAIFESSSLLAAFKIIFEQLQSLEIETPKVKSLVAGYLSQTILDNIFTLEEVGNFLAGGKHHPLFLLCLQRLEKSAGQAWLNERFVTSKINLMEMLPEVDRSKDRLASILKDRCLGFLDPMLTIEPDLWEQMREKDPSPAGLYRWIKENIDQTIQNTPTFVHVLISCLLRYIHTVAMEKLESVASPSEEKQQPQQDQPEQTSSSGPSSNKSSPSSSSLATQELEKELLTRYQSVLQAMLKERQMQLATIYALQLFYFKLDFPKGSLLRWFDMLYDLNIVDDDVFFIWKEEINDDIPGKGQALFQVNTWLNWLAEAESEEEEDV